MASKTPSVPLPEGKPAKPTVLESTSETATPLELAMLAAMIDPDSCKNADGCRDALLHAVALFEESAALCREMGPKDLMGRLDALSQHVEGGAAHLETVLCRTALNAAKPFLTLAVKEGDEDTLRPYLAQHADVDGRRRGKSWFRVRTVQNNLKSWRVHLTNTENINRAEAIRARDERDKTTARTRGCSVEELRAGMVSYSHEEWQDADGSGDAFLLSHAVRENGRIARYEIPEELVDEFIKWKRWIRQQEGGVKAIRPMTRAETFRAAKKKNPEKTRWISASK